jgi:Flp pilus assembly protein TadD
LSVLYRALSRAAAEADGTEPLPPSRPPLPAPLIPSAVIAGLALAGMVLIVLTRGGGHGAGEPPPQADSGPPARSLYLAPPVTEPTRATPEKQPSVVSAPPAPVNPARGLDGPTSPAARLAPESPAAKAWADLALGHSDSALATFDALLAGAPDDANLLLGRAEALARLDQREAALSAYEAVLRRDPDDDRALGQLVRLIGRSRPREVLERLLQLHRGHPEHAGIAAQIGMTYVQMGDLARAQEYLAAAARQEPNRPVYVFNLGVLNDRLGRRKEAMALYERALQLGVPSAVPKAAVEDRLEYLRRVLRD